MNVSTFEIFVKHLMNVPLYDHQNIFLYHWKIFMKMISGNFFDVMLTGLPSKVKDIKKDDVIKGD